jgi:hypothetical protein
MFLFWSYKLDWAARQDPKNLAWEFWLHGWVFMNLLAFGFSFRQYCRWRDAEEKHLRECERLSKP